MAAFLTLAGCGGGDKPKKLETCFPKETQKWIWRASDSAKQNEAKAELNRSKLMQADMATIYVDRSASMVGYLNGANNDNRPFHNLMGNLPVLAKIAGAQSQYRAFGVNISEPMQNAAKQFQDPRFYSCAQKGDKKCESSESHLDRVFGMIADTPDELAIVVTDLWYDNSLDGMGGPTALQGPLTKILQEGRSVSLYGIEAPFSGKIYDIPAGGSAETTTDHKGTHPLFVLVIGQKGDVLELGRQMERSGARDIREGLANGTIKRSIFTVDPGPLVPTKKAPVKVGRDTKFRARPFEAYPGLSIQQFVLDASSAPLPGKSKTEYATWIAPTPEDFLPHTVWQGDLIANVNVYNRRGDACSPWTKISAIATRQEVGRNDSGESQYILPFKSEELIAKMRKPGTYLISGQLERASVDSPNPANDWAEQWSFNGDQSSRLLQRRKILFPTLNLSEVTRIMENALRTATEREGGGIVGFTILVKSED